MKAGWVEVELASACDVFTDGNWIETKDQADEGIRLVQTGNVGQGVFKDRGDKARYIDEATFRRLKCFEIVPGDCLISRLPDPVGRACRIPETGDKMITAVDCTVLRTNEKRLDPDFFIYYSQSAKYLKDVEALCSGTTRSRISRSNLGATKIPLPPLDEQKRIVEVLDAAFEGLSRARAHTETNLKNAREWFESITRAAFEVDGTTVTLEEVADIPSALVDPREAAYADLPHVGAGNMETGSDQLVNVMTAREEKLISGKYTFDTSMVLYSKIRPYLRKSARPEFEGLCSADVYPLRPNPSRLDRNYLFHLLMGPDFTEYAISGSGRVGMPKVNRNHLFAYTFTLPTLAAQREATAKIDAAMEHCDQVATHYRAKLADLDALRQALLQKAFAGELT